MLYILEHKHYFKKKKKSTLELIQAVSQDSRNMIKQSSS